MLVVGYWNTRDYRQIQYRATKSWRQTLNPNTWTADDAASDWITGVMSASIRITSDTVYWTVRWVVVGVTVQLVFERQTVCHTQIKVITLCLKKGTPTVSIVTLRRIDGFSRFFAQTFLTQLAVKWLKFPPHPTSVSTLPGENRINEILHFIQGLLSIY